MRVFLRSLHARMLLLSLLATVVALALAGWAIAGVLERFVIEGLDRRLDAELSLLASGVDADGHVDRVLIRQRIGALDAGPEWRWRVDGPGGTIGSADFPELAPGPPLPGGPGHPRDRDGPDARDDHARTADGRIRPQDGETEDGVRVHARRLTLATRAGPVVLIAAAPRAVVQRPVRAAVVPLLAALGLIALLLGATSVVQLRWGLRPLRRLRDQVAAIRLGTRDRVDEDQPTELKPLAVELNRLATDNATALATARRSAANLAHALKTPVATLALMVRGEPDRAAQVARIDATIRHHLARARIAAIDRRAATLLAPAIVDLVAVVQRLHGEGALSIDVDVAPGLSVAVDPHDLDELVGNLLDNAARHARAFVRIQGAPDPSDARMVRIAVSDDGPGIPAAERDRVAQRGTRLDERGDGHGFGLSIVGELAALYGGTFALDDADGGGLTTLLTLPARLP